MLKKIIQDAKSDPLLKSTLDIEKIINSIDKTDLDYLGDRTLKNIAEEIYECLRDSEFSVEFIEKTCRKLLEYRFVDTIYQLHRGKHVRWIRPAAFNPMLTNGGIVVDIKFLDNGTHIVCKNGVRFIQYKFDDCLTFQKLSQDEQLLLSCYNLGGTPGLQNPASLDSGGFRKNSSPFIGNPALLDFQTPPGLPI